jgi:hypothetical protein
MEFPLRSNHDRTGLVAKSRVCHAEGGSNSRSPYAVASGLAGGAVSVTEPFTLIGMSPLPSEDRDIMMTSIGGLWI